MSSSSNSNRDFDIVLWGATGYTGRLVAECLTQQSPPGIRWALAGRNEKKLESIRSEIGAKSVPILLGDSNDVESLDRLAKRARVVCTTVGPYARYGSSLVGACARAGTSYCDLTGEAHWIRKMIDAHEETARDSGARIVHCCGFDSIPSDLGTWVLQEHAIEKLGGPCDEVRFRVMKMKGSFSGGTFASMQNLIEEAKRDPTIRKTVMDPYGLNPKDRRRGLDGPDVMKPARDDNFGWTAPFIMGAINTRIVRRTNAVLDYPYGADFRYSEAIATGRGLKGRLGAIAITAAMGGLAASMAIGPLKALTARLRPKPGEGPSKEERERGHFSIELLGTRNESGSSGSAKVLVTGDRDPGYGATAKMIAQAALCLAEDDLHVGGGSWTPASAMGSRLVERLNGVGVTFSVQ